MQLTNKKPPKIASWILLRLFDDNVRHTALDDYEDTYLDLVADEGVFKAYLWYWMQVAATLPAFFYNLMCWSATMFRSYFKIGLRNLVRYKYYSLINVSGLSVGLACSLLILFYVLDELRYDTFHEKYDSIYRLVDDVRMNEDNQPFLRLPARWSDEIRSEIPQINHLTMIQPIGSESLFRAAEKGVYEKKFFWVEPSFFDVFSFNFIEGEPETALEEPWTIVITQRMARTLFGNENPMGKIITQGQIVPGSQARRYTVTGILQDPPANSHFTFNLLASYETVYKLMEPNDLQLGWWGYTYMTVQEDFDQALVEEKIREAIQQKFGQHSYFTNNTRLQALKDIHLHSRYGEELEPNNNASDIYMFSAVAVFILLIACFNFMNLSVAQAAKRAKEIGMRKVVGAYRSQLIHQYFTESFVLSFAAILLAMLWISLLLPIFSTLSGKELHFSSLLRNEFILAVLLVQFFVGFLSGSYPAFYLSAINPIKALRGKYVTTSENIFFRKSLIALQFTIAIVLLISVNVVYQQRTFIKEKDLGFSSDLVVSLDTRSRSIYSNAESITNAFKEEQNIIDVSFITMMPGQSKRRILHDYRVQKSEEAQSYRLNTFGVDYNFLNTLNITLLEGRNFSKNHPVDRRESILLNESAVKYFGWNSPIGKVLYEGDDELTVIGVVKDFHTTSLHEEIEPVIIHMGLDWGLTNIAVKITSGDISSTIQSLENRWKIFSDTFPFEYRFLDDELGQQYLNEEKLSNLFAAFSLIAVFITLIGLLGLVSFTVEQKIKEIGIRKILGASISSVTAIISKDFVKVIVLSNLFAWPIAYWLMQNWLGEFAFRIALGAELFLAASALVLLLAIMTISFRTIKAAVTNPINALRID